MAVTAMRPHLRRPGVARLWTRGSCDCAQDDRMARTVAAQSVRRGNSPRPRPITCCGDWRQDRHPAWNEAQSLAPPRHGPPNRAFVPDAV